MSDNGTEYCIRCGKKTEYSIKLQRVRVNICGVRFSYIEKEPCCTNCLESVYVSEIEDQNVDARVLAFNQAKDKLRHKIGSNGGKT
mgnify:CR=1 FL=1